MSRVIKVWGKVECAENILRELLNSKNTDTNVQENSQLLMRKSTTLYKKSFLLNRPKFCLCLCLTLFKIGYNVVCQSTAGVDMERG